MQTPCLIVNLHQIPNCRLRVDLSHDTHRDIKPKKNRYVTNTSDKKIGKYTEHRGSN